MRRDANRSLLVWPAAASAAIIAVTYMHRVAWHLPWEGIKLSRVIARSGLDPDRARGASGVSNGSEHPLWAETVSSSSRGSTLPAERRQFDSGATRTHPAKRSAGLTSLQSIPAPKIDVARELAGFVPHGSAAVPASVPAVALGTRSGNASVDSERSIGDLQQAGVPTPASRPKVDLEATWKFASRAWGVANSFGEKLNERLEIGSGHTVRSQPFQDNRPEGEINDPQQLAPAVLDQGASAVVSKRAAGAAARTTAASQAAFWPEPASLKRQLRALLQASDTRSPSRQLVSLREQDADWALADPKRWATQVQGRLNELLDLPRLGDPRAGTVLDELARLASEGLRQAEKIRDRRVQMHWLTAGHALTRRTEVWSPVWKLQNELATGSDDGVSSEESGEAVIGIIAEVRSQLAETGDPDGWNRFLLLDAIEALALADGGRGADPSTSAPLLSQRFLSRLQWHGLHPTHREWLDRESIVRLARVVRGWNQTEVDYAKLLRQIERKESNPIDLVAIDIANTAQALRFARVPERAAVSEAIDTHYRNANVRLAITDSLIERLLPQAETETVPVNGVLFGSRIYGNSTVTTDLNLRLIPAREQWSMELQTHGDVHTRSVGKQSGIEVRTSGIAVFDGGTPITVTRNGFQVGDSDVSVEGSSRLRDVCSKYDGWPLFGRLVRAIAVSRFQQLRPRTQQYSNHRIQSQAARAIDDRVDEAILTATDRINETLLGPLGKLDLDPQVVDLETTDARLLSRYRVAGDWQLSAYTPRPRAPSSSLMSVQVHESAINNIIEQLAPRDEPESIEEMARRVLTLFGRTDVDLDDDLPSDVLVQFAPTRPVTVEVDDGKLWVTFRIVRLSQRDRMDLRRFIVRATYRPEVDGLNARFIREGHLSISGPRLSARERLPARAIFNKVLSNDRAIPLMLPKVTDHPAFRGTAVSQLELRDGWIGLAVSDAESQRIAIRDTRSTENQ